MFHHIQKFDIPISMNLSYMVQSLIRTSEINQTTLLNLDRFQEWHSDGYPNFKYSKEDFRKTVSEISCKQILSVEFQSTFILRSDESLAQCLQYHLRRLYSIIPLQSSS